MSALTDPTWWAAAWPYIVSGVGVLALLWRIVRAVWPVLRRFARLVDDLTGEPERPGFDARPGVMQRLQVMEARTAQLVPNGGGSIKDAVTRIDERTEHLGQRLAAVERLVVPGRTEEET